MNSFPRSKGLAYPKYDDFFRWVPTEQYLLQSDPDDASMFALVRVDGDLIAEYRATVLPPDPTPVPGFYIVRWDPDAEVTVESYGDNECAAVQDMLVAVVS